jgi:hypothetical protein
MVSLNVESAWSGLFFMFPKCVRAGAMILCIRRQIYRVISLNASAGGSQAQVLS